MDSSDLSAIGVDASTSSKPTEFAKKEDQLFALDKAREDHDHARRVKTQDLGAVGRLFGSRDNAITYIIAFLVLLSCGLVALFSFEGSESSKTAIEFFKAIGFAGMGYLTGKSLETKKDN